jgi:ribonuclease Y
VGTHTALGIDAARRYGEKPEVLHAMAAHHFDVEPQTLEAVLVQVADTLSAARPGARKEPLELYMQRMRALEQLVGQFKGVQRAFVIQAGREVRVMVEPDTISEDSLPKLAFEIAQKVEQELDYPGQIKISLIRETRANTFAR